METGPKREMDRTGSVGMGRFTGRPRRRVYKGCGGKKFLIFSFLSLSIFPLERENLFSLLTLISPAKVRGGAAAAARWSTTVSGGAAASELKAPPFLIFFWVFYSMSSSTPISLLKIF